MLSIKLFKYTVVLHEYLASNWVTLPATHKVWGIYKSCKQLSPYIIVFMLFAKVQNLDTRRIQILCFYAGSKFNAELKSS